MSESVIQRAAGVAPTAPPRATAKQVAAVVAGNTLEFYDFLTYAYFAIYIGQTFFPSHNPTTSLLASLATYGAGFLTRPVGAIVIGRLGDRLGRKPAMILSFSLMGAAIVGLALTPSYAAIGITAPVLVIIFRLLQGFALGGELGPSTSFLIEAAPPGRRGLFVSFQYAGQGAAALMAGIIGVALAHLLTPEGLRDYGWRIAMLFGAAVVPVGLILRNNLEETLHHPEVEASAPETASLRPYLKIAILAGVMMAAGTTVANVLKYMTTYAIGTLGMSPELAFTGTIVGGIVGITANPIGGLLSDRIGRKPVMFWPWLTLLFAVLPAFWVLSEFRTPLALYGSVALLGGIGSMAACSVLVSITESLPKRVRSGSLALIYSIAVTIFGGTAQFNVAWLTSATGSPMAPAWYMMVGVACGLLAIVLMPESSPARRSRG